MTKKLKYIEFSFDERERELRIKVGDNEVIIRKIYITSLQRFLIRIAEKMSHRERRKKRDGNKDNS